MVWQKSHCTPSRATGLTCVSPSLRSGRAKGICLVRTPMGVWQRPQKGSSALLLCCEALMK